MMSTRFLIRPRTASIVGCPFSGGQGKAGTERGPASLIDAGLVTDLKKLNWRVDFRGHMRLGDLHASEDPDIGKMKNPRLVSQVCRAVADTVSEKEKRGFLPVSVGGDHSLAIGTLSGTLRQHPDACVIWVDAHADINTPETSDTGNIHGMPLSFMLGINGTKIPEFSWINTFLKPSKLVYIGLRDIDPGERRILRDYGVKAFSMHEVDQYGIGPVVQMALDHVNPDRDQPIHLSFDVDALDPSVAPSTGTPVRGGLTFREGHYICEAIWKTGLLVALDVMEINPLLGDTKSVLATVEIGRSLVRSALGETLLSPKL